jgi:hypothetical protein
VWGNGQREFVAGQQNAAALLVAQFQMFLELREGGNSVFELPFPIVPEFRAVSGPIPGACETKSFPSPFSEAKVFIFVWTKKLRPLNIVSMQALGRALRTWMNHARGAVTAPSTTRSTADAFLEQHSLPLATRMSPVHASRVTTTRLVPRGRRLLGATLAAGGPSPRRS